MLICVGYTYLWHMNELNYLFIYYLCLNDDEFVVVYVDRPCERDQKRVKSVGFGHLFTSSSSSTIAECYYFFHKYLSFTHNYTRT